MSTGWNENHDKDFFRQLNEHKKRQVTSTIESNNYIRIKKYSLIKSCYAYVDVSEYLADDIFYNKKINVDYLHEFSHPEHGYRIIICNILKWQEKKFTCAMEELKDKMLICGHGDYLEFCKKLEEDVRKYRESN